MIKRLKFILVLLLVMSFSTTKACRYTIREIGFSTLSKVTYILYRIDENSSFIPKQQIDQLTNSNVKVFGLNLKDDPSSRIIKFAKEQDLSYPVYVLAAPDGRMLALSGNNIESATILSPVRQQLIDDLPKGYAAVILVEGTNTNENNLAKEKVLKACDRVENIMPHMPKQVANGPRMIVVSNDQFQEEKVMLWSFGIDKIPDHPIAFVVYGKGRIMGDSINYADIQKDKVYKLLSIIGADCECGLDRKWMLGYQMPLDWPTKTRQSLSDILGFDVDNPMVLTEMSRILAIENRVATDPDGISFEPIVIDLEKEFNDVPEIEHNEDSTTQEDNISSSSTIIYSVVFIIILVIIGAFIVLKKNQIRIDFESD